MSIQAIAWVLDHSRAEGLDRLVLLSLANHANSDTGQCDPGYRRIAAEANCSRGTVANAVTHLVELGEVAVLETGRGKATTKYHLPWLSTGLRSVQPGLDARESVASNQTPVASNPGSVASTPGLDETIRTNRTANDDAVLNSEKALAAIERARNVIRSSPVPVSKLFTEIDDTPDAAKTRHPSNLPPPRKDLE